MDTLILLMAQVFGLAGNTTNVVAPTLAGNGPAVLEGQFMYPGCAAPSDLRVCAQDPSTGLRYCAGPSKPGSDAFVLEVPAGQYEVFAEAPATRPGYRAFYNESVRCGLSVDCRDHSPVLVAAAPGQRIENVNPADWFGAALEVLR